MAKFSVDTKCGELLKDPAVVAIIESYIPNMTKQPQIKMAYGMTFRKVASFPQAGLTKEQVAEIDKKLQALG
jgi:hypothetical protein